MAVLKDYDYHVQRMNNLPNYDKCFPSSYQKRMYKDVPKNEWGDDQCPDCDYFMSQTYGTPRI